VRVAVFGTGGVGGYFGGRLAQAGEDVVFIARGQHLAAIRHHGLQVSSVAGDFMIQPAIATDAPASVDPVDLVLVGVKAWQVNDAAAAMRPLIRPGTMVLPLQNGIEAPKQLADVLGGDHVLGGLCRLIALVGAPGHIRHTGVEPYIAFGELDSLPSERIEQLRQAFTSAQGVRVEIPTNIQVAMWSKIPVHRLSERYGCGHPNAGGRDSLSPGNQEDVDSGDGGDPCCCPWSRDPAP
jgi:2-dehydropantoate 2-reductase